MSIQEELDDIYVRIGAGEPITDKLHKRIDDLKDALMRSNICEHCKYWLRVSEERGLCSANQFRDYEDRVRLAPTRPAQSCGKFTRINPDVCSTCAYYDTDGHSGYGQCRKKSPHPSPQAPKGCPSETRWPATYDTDWCGEHKSKL